MTVLSRNGAAISIYPTSLAVSSGDSFDIDFEFGGNPTYIMAFIRHASGEISNLTLYTDYDVSIAESPGYNNSWGTFTLKNDYQNCSALCVYRKIENSQDIAYSSQTIFATTTEEALDKLTMLVQDEDYGSRAITAPKDDLLNPTDMELPNRELRANTVITFDETGNILTRPVSDFLVEVVDNLDSTDSEKALSANMGHTLNTSITAISTDVNDLEIKVAEINKQIEDLVSRISTEVNDLEIKVTEINKQIEDLVPRISTVENNLTLKQDIISAGQGIHIIDGKIINVDIATKEKVGIVKPGTNIDIEFDGTINVTTAPSSYSVSEIQTAIIDENSGYKCFISDSNVLIFVLHANTVALYKGLNFESLESTGTLFSCGNLDSISAFGSYFVWADYFTNNMWREENGSRMEISSQLSAWAPTEIQVQSIMTAFQTEGGLYAIIEDSNSQLYKLLFYDNLFSQRAIVVIDDLGNLYSTIKYYYSLAEKVLYFWHENTQSLTLISHENPNSPQVLKTYTNVVFPVIPNTYVFSNQQGIISDDSNGYLFTLTDSIVGQEALKINDSPAFGLYVDNGEIIALDFSNELIGLNNSATESVVTLPLKNSGGTASNFQAIKFNNEIYILNYLSSSGASRIEYRKIIKL